MSRLLRSMFALIAFATEPRSFRAGLIPADAAAREAAEAWIDALSASGGTAIRVNIALAGSDWSGACHGA